MREPFAGRVSPAPPSPLLGGSSEGSGATSAHPPPQIPDHELSQPIGRGAYGLVWLARNVMGTLRAVKVVHRHDFGDEHPFEREFKGIQKFEPISRSHPGLINILQIGRNDAEGYFYYVMELGDPAGNPKSETRNPKETRTPNAEAATESTQVRASDFELRSNFEFRPSTLRSPDRLGTEDGSDLYTPRTVRHDLQVRGRLPAGECVELGLALTSALAHLHQRGLVHRDIKPSNIIFVGGQPKLADIGLVTEAGDSQSIVGTEGYLAPEGPGTPQADLFSLGKVLYEVSTGQDRRQFPDLPVELKEWPDAPGLRQLNEVVLAACAKDLARRYRSAEEMHADLARLQAGKSVRWRGQLGRTAERAKRVWPILAAGVLLLAGLPWLIQQPAPGPAAVPAEKASVFVLPFRSEESNAVPGDLCGRITDAFIDSLALIDGVRRSPRKSGWVYHDEDLLRRSLAETNDMRHILAGRIGGAGDSLVFTLRLYGRGVDQPAWTENYSGSTNELITLERRAVAGIAGVLGLNITEVEQQKICQLLTNNLEALRWMRQAYATYQRKAGTQIGYTEVSSLTQTALELDPNYTDAEATMVCQIRNLAQERPPIEVWPAVFRGMSQVLEKDDTRADALDQLAAYALVYKRDWIGVYDLFNRELRSRSGGERHWVQAFWYRIHGWAEEARVHQQESERPEPKGSDHRFSMAASRWVERRYAEGAQVARRTLELYPNHAEGYFWLAHCLVAAREFEAGLEAIQKAQEVWKKQEMTALKGYAYARMGQPEKARQVLQELMELRRTGPYLQPYFIARVHAALGENATALEWLEKAAADRSEYPLMPDFGGLRTDPAWDGLQNEPRYWRLCDSLGLGKTQWPPPKPKEMQ
ncbi:MAG TPA: serine/threonine-protein kinase [Verrucomicrobiae bacterium]